MPSKLPESLCTAFVYPSGTLPYPMHLEAILASYVQNYPQKSGMLLDVPELSTVYKRVLMELSTDGRLSMYSISYTVY